MTTPTTPIMTAETETIPEDVQQMAVQFRCCSSDGCIRHDDECGEQGLCIEGRQIARAILAERERCAKVADEAAKRYRGTLPGFNGSIISNVGGSVAEDIAKSIRNPTP